LATIFPLGRDGAVVGVVLRDITDFQRFEELQRRARQVEMIQRLAGGIAHDFNNLLTGIMANSSLILDTAACGSRIEQCARDIVASSERAAELVRYMLAFSGRRVHVSEGVQLPDVLTEIEAKLRALLPERIRLFINVDQAVPSLTADRSQLTDLIEILFRNALEATESRHSGRIAIHVGTCGRSVLLEVEDDGCGIDPADVPRIFEPFFTTKFLGRGLGLAAAEGIATSCGGQIQVESAPGRGTTFRLLFPTDGKGLATR
jgi:signal transduction histidine kinase